MLPGLQDITSSVDFTMVADSGAAKAVLVIPEGYAGSLGAGRVASALPLLRGSILPWLYRVIARVKRRRNR